MAQAEQEARFEDYLAAQQDAAQHADEDFDPFAPGQDLGLPPDFTADDLREVGYTEADTPLKAEVRALTAQAQAHGIDTNDLLAEVFEDTKYDPNPDAYYERARDELRRAIAEITGGRSHQEAAGNAQGQARQDAQRGGNFDVRQADGTEGAPGTDGKSSRPVGQDLLGDKPNASQQQAADARAAQARKEQQQRNAAPSADEFTLGMEDARTGREVDPGQGELLGGELRFSRTAGRFDAFRVPASTVQWLGFDGAMAWRADLQALAQRHPEYYESAAEVRQDIDYVMQQPDGWYIHDGSKVTVFREGGGNQIPQVRVELERSGDGLVVRSVYVGNRRQIAKKMQDKRQRLERIGLGGQSLDSLTVAEYLEALGDRSSRPESPSDNSPDAKPHGNQDGTGGQSVSRSFAGQQAATADKLALATAQERLESGEDAETIRKDTGWHKAADGRWRFEISDADAKLKGWIGNVTAKQLMDANGGAPITTKDFSQKYPGHTLSAQIQLADDLRRSSASNPNVGVVTLGEVLEHPALFAAYPALRELRVLIDDAIPIGNAAFYPESGAIAVGPVKQDAALSAMLHEIQHGIQDVEGFASGGSPLQFAAGHNHAQARLKDAQSWFDAWDGELRRRKNGDGPSDSYGHLPDKMIRSRVKEAKEKLVSAQAYAQRNDATKQYQSLAGEAEARNTQTRQKMTDAERRATPPSATQDVADADVIVTFNGKEAHNAPAPANAATAGAPQPAKTGSTVSTIAAAIRQAYGNVLGQLQAKGLVTLVQSQDEAIDAAAKARADKTGEPAAQVREKLLASVSMSLSPMKSIEANVRRGREALARALDEKTSVHRAMFRNGLGWVDFVWGDVGTVKPNGKTKDAMGLAHIIEARQRKDGMSDAQVVQLLDRLVQAIASGQELRRNETGGSIRVVVERDGVEATLVQNKGSNAWLLSGWEVKNPDGLSAANVATEPTLARPTTSQPNKGAGFAEIIGANDLDIKRSADGAIQGFYDPQSGQSFLIADGLTAEVAPGVLVHEVGVHMARDTQDARGKAAFDKMLGRAGELRKLGRGVFFERVNQRLRDSGETSNEEAAAYIAEEYERDRVNAPASVKRWVTDFMAAVSAWLFGKGVLVKASDLGAADIAAIARANVRRAANDGPAMAGDGPVRRSDASPTENEVRGLVQQYASTEGAPTEAQMREAVRQYRDTERAYGGRPAYDKAKAAWQTKLAYGQWVQVRTENFKNWFGDWQAVRARDDLQNMDAIPARLEAAFGSDFGQAKALAKAEFDKLRVATERDGFAVVASDGRKIAFSGRGFKEVAQHAADRRVLSASANLQALFESAVPLYSSKPEDVRQQVAAFHYYGVKADFGKDGQAFVLLEVVERSNGDFFYDADATSVEEVRAASSAPLADQTKSGAGGFGAARAGRLAQWFAGVNPEAVSKVVDPATGEPLVVYHGTHGDFSAFQSQDRVSTDSGMLGSGHYFAPDPKRASDWYASRMDMETGERLSGGNVMSVFLNARNPLEIRLQPGQDLHGALVAMSRDMGLGRMPSMSNDAANAKWAPLFTQALRERGHDGVQLVLSSGATQEVSVFDGASAKSATGNIGTFDGANGDVRFSRKSPAPAVRTDDEPLSIISRINDKLSGVGARVHLAATFAELPQKAQDAAHKAGVPPDEFRGVTLAGGQVYLVQGNHSGASDVQATVVHEVYGHVGLRALFGPDIYRRLNKLYLSLGESKMRALAEKYGMADSYFSMAEAVKAGDKMTRRAGGPTELRNGWLTEELLAHIAERETGTLRQQAREVIGAIRAWLREHGFARLADMGMTDIAHILKQGRLALENGNGFTGVDAPPAFRRVDTATQGDTYALPEERLGGLRRKMQDYFIRALQTQEAVASQGGTVNEQTDFYRAEELSSGRRAALVQDFANNTVEPLMKRAAKLGVGLEELALYAYAKHAQERNEHIATINDRFADGGSGMKTADANAVLDKVHQEGRAQAFEELHQGLMGITAKTRALLLSEGLITADEFNAMQGQYQNYIPLRGFERVDERGEPSGRGAGKGFNIRGKETM
ncbi:MAG: hypothetical protein JSR53_04325, partial [Proteobacteria bacterium]|nr:hypothetical protein [Pseudomonadota bacterium]